MVATERNDSTKLVSGRDGGERVVLRVLIGFLQGCSPRPLAVFHVRRTVVVARTSVCVVLLPGPPQELFFPAAGYSTFDRHSVRSPQRRRGSSVASLSSEHHQAPLCPSRWLPCHAVVPSACKQKPACVSPHRRQVPNVPTTIVWIEVEIPLSTCKRLYFSCSEFAIIERAFAGSCPIK